VVERRKTVQARNGNAWNEIFLQSSFVQVFASYTVRQ